MTRVEIPNGDGKKVSGLPCGTDAVNLKPELGEIQTDGDGRHGGKAPLIVVFTGSGGLSTASDGHHPDFVPRKQPPCIGT